jgi:hypothetical protein
VAGLSLSLLLVVGPLAWVTLHDRPYVASTARSTRAQPQPALATEALARLQRAVARRDGQAVRALAPRGDDRAAGRLAAVVANARSLDVRDFTLRYVDEEGAVAPDGTWSAAVDTTWRLAGFDPAPAETEVTVRFRVQDGHAAVVGLGGGDRRTPVWLSGPARVLRGPGTLVLVADPPGATDPGAARRRAEEYAARARAAVPVVHRVLPGWRPRLVVEVPATAAGLDRALDADPGEYAGIAAVTTTPDGSTAPGAPAHVFVNPRVFGGLRPQGAQVVMSHETVHVATDAALSTMPLWLLEGFADYVALRDVHLPLRTTAGQVIRQVRRDGPPRALPDRHDFGTAAPHLGAAYEAAWLACRVLVDDGGEQALVRFYRRVDAGTDLDAALRASYGLDLRAFTAQWRARLARVAS